jgi:hypothetical protein
VDKKNKKDEFFDRDRRWSVARTRQRAGANTSSCQSDTHANTGRRPDTRTDTNTNNNNTSTHANHNHHHHDYHNHYHNH